MESQNEDIIVLCARAAHEMNRVYCRGIGDFSQPSWDDAPDWQKESAIKGVEGALNGNTPEESHKSWLAEKERTGWTFGQVKDPVAKTHPCMVPYQNLPRAQKKKDEMFLATVRAMHAALS